ncbi:diguanylate cyclase [Kineosporia succinea]|uniref:Diguanylate cyclase (GGDEF)-like protein n=1 Tax=Kineosporia succinea TaxID=84632 RepID=A0ABT9P7I5_9ACTN|nr:diguanylate cyclase [Kineosporia succinea]MDP9828651.1 diguanylate cyclase (GGDEF)-like protein [Kineosporia succinea]
MTSSRQVSPPREATRVPAARDSGRDARDGRTHNGTLAGFEIVEQLGNGAESTVFKVRRPEDAATGHRAEYALKILDKPLADSHEAEAAFRREAALLAGVNHPGLVKVYEVGALDRRPYLVMDLVSGRALSQVLEGGALSTDKVIAIVLDIVEPLAAVHDKGLVHRDLKPANVVIMEGGEARLIDFGLTARDGEDGETSAAVGTLAYSAPEQGGTLKRPVDNRSDLYSIGVIMFQALSGVLPFSSPDLGELLRMHAVVPAPDLNVLVPSIQPALAEVVATLLAKDPDDRYQSGRDLAADLRALAGMPRQNSDFVTGHETALFGRNAEISVLSGRWNEVRNGRSGVALVHGGGGTGKTRLVSELLTQVRESGSTVLQATCVPDSPVPFAPIRDAILNHLQEIARMPVGDRWRRRSKIRAASAGWSPAMLGRIAPGLEAILNGSDTLKGKDNLTARTGLGGSKADGQAKQAEPEPMNESQFAVAIAGFLAALARQTGDLLLFLDDVQWLDAGSREVVGHLAAQMAESKDSKVLILAASRDEVEYAEGLGAFYHAAGMSLDVEVPVVELDEESIGLQIRSLIPGLDVGSSLVEILSRRSNGNPFVAGEYLSAVIDAGLLQPFWGAWKLDEEGLDRLELPQDAVGLVLTRLQNLAPGTYELLVTAAVIGNEFHGEVLAAVMGLTGEEVLPALSEAVGQRLIDTREGGAHVFLHDRVRQALQAQLGEDELAALHLRIAEALEDALAMGAPGSDRPEHAYSIAHHYMQCDPDSDQRLEKIFDAAWRAGRLALANHAPNEAINFLEFAAGLRAKPPTAFLVELAHALKQNGRLEAARNRTEQALAGEIDPVRRAEMMSLLADLYKDDWDNSAALTAVRLGLAELGTRVPDSRTALYAGSILRFARARLLGGRRELDEAERRRLLVTVQLHSTASFVALFAQDHGLAFAHALRARAGALRLRDGAGSVAADAAFGMVAAWNGWRRAARRAFARMDADEVSQVPTRRATNSYLRGMALYGGNLDDGVDWTRDVEADGPWMELGQELDALAVFATRAAVMGRTAEAQHWLDRGRNRQTGRNVDATPFIVAAPLTMSLLGRFPEAGTELRHIRQVCERVPTLDMLRQLATLFQLAEQRDFGSVFDTVASEVENQNPRPERVFRAHHPLFYLIAVGRLAQLRAAGEAERGVALEMARFAVQQAAKHPGAPELEALALLVRADLEVAEGRPHNALNMLGRIGLFLTPDSPTVSFEVARVRARALTVLGTPEARRQAQHAYAVAIGEGWPHRAQAVATEFALGTDWLGSGVSGTHSSTAGGTYTAGHERLRLQALQTVSAAAAKVLDPRILARIALDETIKLLSADRAYLFLVPDDAAEASLAGGLATYLGRDADGRDIAELTGYSTTLVDRVRQTGQPQVFTGTEEGAVLGTKSVVAHGLRSVLAAPMKVDGRMTGVVYLDSQVAKGIFTAGDVDILSALTNHIATSMETARVAQLQISVETADRERAVANNLRDALREMAEKLDDPTKVLKELLMATGPVLGTDRAWLLSVKDGVYSLRDSGDSEPLVIEEDAKLRGLLAIQQPRVGSKDLVPGGLATQLGEATSWISVPMRSRRADLGVLIVATTANSSPTVDLAQTITTAAVLAAQGLSAYDNSTLFQQVQNLAVVDELTGVPNRRRFFEVGARDLAGAKRHGRQLTALMIDIDHFKKVNDTYGHPTGDDVIKTVADRFRQQIRKTDVLGRYGGEEFAVLLQDAQHDGALPERLRACIAEEPVQTRSGPLEITVSVGMTFLDEEDEDVATLLARADQGLYKAKQNGRNQVMMQAELEENVGH